MHRSRTFTAPHVALPPLGAAGWLGTALSEPGPRRDARPGFGEFSDRPPRGDIEPARPIAKAQRWTRPFTSALHWLHRVRHLRIQKA